MTQIVDRYAGGAPERLPHVAIIGERLYIVDGNHRLAAAMRRGEKTADVWLVKL